jgi:hypothetical protein
MSFHFSPRIITDGLVLYLDAGNILSYNGSGNTWTDLSRSSRNGELINGPTFSSLNGGSIVFDGTDDYIRFGQIGEPANINFAWTPSGIGNNSFTIDFWIKSSDDGYYISKPWHGSGEYNYFIWKSGNFTYIRLLVGNQTTSFFFNNTLYDLNTWTHYAFVATPTQMGLYRNGGIVIPLQNHNITNNNPGGPGNTNVSLTLMTLYPYQSPFSSPGFSILGNLSQIRFYNKALSSSEILQNYNATKTRFGL